GGVIRRIDGAEAAEDLRDLPRRLVPELVARRAACRLEVRDPLRLAAHRLGDAVAARSRAGELALVRHGYQCEPVVGRVVLRGGSRIWRDDRGEVQRVARYRLHLWRINETVAANQDVVGCLRQIRHNIPTLSVGDDDPVHLRWQIRRLGDHPDASFGPARAGYDAADIVGIDGDGGAHPGGVWG